MTLENDQSSDRSSIDNDRNEHQQQQRQQQQQQQQPAPKSVKSVLRSTTKSGYVANMEGVKGDSEIGGKLANGHDESTTPIEQVETKLGSKDHQTKKILKKDQKQEKGQQDNTQVKAENIGKEESLDMKKDSKVNHKKNKDAAEKEDTTANQADEDSSGVDSNGNPLAEDDMKDEDTLEVHIQSPGAELLTIQLSSMELVQEIHQLLMDREDTCHRTCFSLQLDGVTLDNFAELKTIEGLHHGSVIKVVEDLYTMREARIHVRHVRDLLKSMDPADAYNGIECNSLTFLHAITQGDLLEKKKSRPDSVDCTPPEYIMPGVKEPPLLPLQPGIGKNAKGGIQQALKVLTTSAWNPPPGPRKLHGDLMYLYVVTMEDKRFHISACPRGFYINQSTDDVFNPKPDIPSHLCHSLIDLLSQISPTFKRAFQQMQKKRTLRHAFERVATPYQIYQWIAPHLEHTIDAIRAEDAFSSKLGYEEHIPGQTRDWNEELQTTRELPRKTLPERLLRERAIFKVHGDFVIAATRGAMAVIDGNVLAINPGEDPKMQMFIWNNIFFSLGFDVRDHYKELGGDVAAFVAPRNDLHGVRVYSAVDIEGLYTLGTVVVDYRGYRVTAQSIIPGILEREQEQSVVYGSIDFGKTVLSHPKYLELLQKAGKHLKILPHWVLNERNEPVELCSSVECKGIIGNDGRYYILDLLRTFPPDVNFLKLDIELSPELKAMGFPIEHKHKLSCLRQELLESFVEDRYVRFIRNAARHLQDLDVNRRSGEGISKGNKVEIGKENKNQESNQKHLENDKKSIDDVKNDEGNSLENAAKDNILDNNGNIDSNKIEQETETKEKNEEDNKSVDEGGDVKMSKLENDVNIKEAKKEKQLTEKEEKKLELVNKILNNEENVIKLNDYAESTELDATALDIIKGAQASVANNDEKDAAEVVRQACAAVGSLKEKEFDFRFNPDVFSSGIRHVEDPAIVGVNALWKQKRLVQEAAEFLVLKQIPAFIKEHINHSSPPMDGNTVTEAMHSHGINIRYLGKVITTLSQVPRMLYLQRICVMELLIRAAKHIYFIYIQNTDIMHQSASISHFLNCFLSSGPISVHVNVDELQKSSFYNGIGGGGIGSSSGKRRNKNRNSTKNNHNGHNQNYHHKSHHHVKEENHDWTQLTSRLLWQQIRKEAKSYWDFDLEGDSIDQIVQKYSLQRTSILRAFCLKVGIQILLREYNFEQRNRSTFNEEDILNVFPIIKHISPRASDAYNFYTTGQSKIHQGLFKEGYELISEALNLLNNVFGAIHTENGTCLRMLARLSYLLGDAQEALAIQQRSVIMSERVNGIDHSSTIMEYTHLSLYCFANGQISTSLKLLYRARYLMILICGEDHPEVALIDSNISLILHAVGEYELSLRFIEHALKLNLEYFGEKSMHVAVSYHLVARTQSCMGDFRSALNNEKETYSIYKTQLGEQHEKTKESAERLRLLTQQAVLLQRKMNDIYSNGKLTTGLPPIHIQPPTMGSVLDMLNTINGILFVQISQKDIAKVRTEIEKHLRTTTEMDGTTETLKLLASNTKPIKADRTVEISANDAKDSNEALLNGLRAFNDDVLNNLDGDNHNNNIDAGIVLNNDNIDDNIDDNINNKEDNENNNLNNLHTDRTQNGDIEVLSQPVS